MSAAGEAVGLRELTCTVHCLVGKLAERICHNR